METFRNANVTTQRLPDQLRVILRNSFLLPAMLERVMYEVGNSLTLKLLMSYIYGAPSKARNANVVYIWTYVWQR